MLTTGLQNRKENDILYKAEIDMYTKRKHKL
jgi:hypothetical protein